MNLVDEILRDVITDLTNNFVQGDSSSYSGEPDFSVTSGTYYTANTKNYHVVFHSFYTEGLDKIGPTVEYFYDLTIKHKKYFDLSLSLNNADNDLVFRLLDIISERYGCLEGAAFKINYENEEEYERSKVYREESPFSNSEQANIDNSWEEHQCK
jgi:hypothetical protein